jgi:UDP-glucose 4-epimerase
MGYLVTGGTGLIGSRIVRDLIREGEQVVVYDLCPQQTVLEQLLNREEISRVKIVQGDVTDLPHLIHTVKENNVEKIFHMAYLLSLASAENPSLAIKVNCEGTNNVFETARILGIKRVVWPGTVDEETAPMEPGEKRLFPPSVYLACKRLNSVLSDHYFEEYGSETISVSFPLVYGAWQRLGSVSGSIVRELVENIALGKPGKVPFGDDIHEWLYVDDAARGSLLASKVAITKSRIFTVLGDVRSLREVADYIRELIPGADITLLPGKTGYVPRGSAINEESGCSFQWSMKQGIKETINNLRRQHGLPTI